MGTLVQAENLTVEFSVRSKLFRPDIVQAIKKISLTITKGEILSVVGESGSGKTTLGRALLRLIDVKDGRIIFEDTDLTKMSQSQLGWFRRRAQAVFQDPFSSINPFMNIREIVEEPLKIHGIGDRMGRVIQALEDVRLSPADQYIDKYPHSLSGGQRQRVGIARALVIQPDFIVADEPVSMIDASSRSEILHLLRDLQTRYGLTILYITHDIATARHFSNRIAVMYLGEIVEIGESLQVVTNPVHPYTQALISSVPSPDPANRFRIRPTLMGDPPSPTNIPSGCLFHPRCPISSNGICDTLSPRLEVIKIEYEVACHFAKDQLEKWHRVDGHGSQ